MDSPQLADLDLETIITLTGMPNQKEIVNPKNPKEMAKRVKVTFRPLPKGYNNESVIQFRKKLEEKLKYYGVQVIPWEEATEIASDSFILRILRIRKVKHSIHAVIDVERDPSFVRKIMSSLAEKIYHYLRSPDMSVMEILKTSGWADDFAAKYVQDPYNTQIITITALNQEFVDENTPYDRKIAIGLQNLIRTMSEIVIGVSEDKFSIINMNLSDSIFSSEQLDDFILNSLIPKMYAPIKPPVLKRFEKGEYDPTESPYALQLASLGKQLKNTDLFPLGSRFSEKISRLSHRDVVEKILEGRTGVSYGFIAIVEAPKYEGPKEITKNEWESLSEINGLNRELVRQNDNGRWYVRTVIRGKEVYQQVPDIWVVTSRSGCDKTNLDPNSDVIRIGLVKGKLYLQTPQGVDLQRRDIRPSFDTYVILAQAFSAALYAPELIKEGMPIVHFHGYPDPEWFRQSEYHVGARNPSMPCGTIEAALLNYSSIYKLANKNGIEMNLLCLVESDHGVNILGPNREYLVERLIEGAEQGRILLGGKYLPYLKEKDLNYNK
jgi:hypothetical protein